MTRRNGICILRCNKRHIHGIVNLIESDGVVRISVSANSLSPGKHGFHIHRSGNDIKGCDSMCDHYNPYGHTHGDLNEENAHVGDLGNIIADGNGKVDTTLIATRFTLSEVFGRSIIVHADEDDLGRGSYPDSKTTGHSGKRVLCGIIGIDEGAC